MAGQGSAGHDGARCDTLQGLGRIEEGQDKATLGLVGLGQGMTGPGTVGHVSSRLCVVE
jgi:hypothetical protein